MKTSIGRMGHNDIRIAIRKFQEEGEVITRLPPEETSRIALLADILLAPAMMELISRSSCGAGSPSGGA